MTNCSGARDIFRMLAKAVNGSMAYSAPTESSCGWSRDSFGGLSACEAVFAAQVFRVEPDPYPPLPMLRKRLVMLFLVALGMCKKEICAFVTAASRKRDDVIYLPTFRTVDRLEAARTMPILLLEQILLSLRVEAATSSTSRSCPLCVALASSVLVVGFIFEGGLIHAITTVTAQAARWR